MLKFSEFVKLYWQKKTRGGDIYTREMVGLLEGMNLWDANQYFRFCQNKPAELTDEELIALNPLVKDTPLGLFIGDRGALDDPDVLDSTLDKVTLRQLLAALGK